MPRRLQNICNFVLGNLHNYYCLNLCNYLAYNYKDNKIMRDYQTFKTLFLSRTQVVYFVTLSKKAAHDFVFSCFLIKFASSSSISEMNIRTYLLTSTSKTTDDRYYDLSGRSVSQPKDSGVYIHHKKKIIVR